MEFEQLQRAIEAILFAAGERMEISRLSEVLEVDPDEIEKAADAMADEFAFQRRGIRILKPVSYTHLILLKPFHGRPPGRR